MGIIKINLAARFRETETSQGKFDERERADQVRLSENSKVVFADDKAMRMGTIRARVKMDFYSRPEVKERVIEGLLRDLHSMSV